MYIEMMYCIIIYDYYDALIFDLCDIGYSFS